MTNTVKTTSTVCLFVFALATSALAQSRLVSAPAPAVSGPAYDLGVGYSYLKMSVPSVGHASLSGLDASGTVALSARWGATLDTSYLRASNILATTHQGYMLSVHGGPVFYPLEHGSSRLFIRGLAGAALVDGAVPINSTQYFHGWLLRPSFIVGGGIEHRLSNGLTMRVAGDYMRSSFYDAKTSVQAQNNLRATVSFVFRLKERQHKHAQLW